MTPSEILILASERFNSAEIAAAAGISLPRAEMARADALVTLERQRRQKFAMAWERQTGKRRG